MSRGPAPDRAADARVSLRMPAACALVLGLAAVWGAWPLRQPEISLPAITASSEPVRAAPAPLDVGAFRAPLWIVAAPPPPPPPAPPPSPPLKLQLLAILQENGVYKAAIYDPDTDKLLIVASGERVAGRQIERISTNAVDLRDGDRTRTLALMPEGQR